MNFLQWLNSLGELLYEVMSWLVFFPVTLWRAVRHPLRTMAYSDAELGQADDEQYTDVLSPPLFLTLALLLSHMLALAMGNVSNPILASKDGLAGLVKDETSFLILRLVIFSFFPMMLATRLTTAKRVPLTRKGLKAPFYAQCFPAAPFALFLGVGTSLSTAKVDWAGVVGPAVIVATILGYVAVQSIWFSRELSTGIVRGAGHALLATGAATLAMLCTAALFI